MAEHAPLALIALAALALLATLAQGQDDSMFDDKRGIAALARNGDLPSAQNGESDNNDKRFAHPLAWRRPVEEEKRFAHPLSRQTPQREEKRFAHALAAQWAAAREAEDEALAELLNELHKRMGVSALARSGGLPGKRNIAAMARDGYLAQRTRQQIEEDELAAAQAAAEQEDVEEDEGIQADKRNLASLARNYNVPTGGVREDPAEIEDELEDALAEKRNIQALLRTMRPARTDVPKDESKRYLGSVLANGRRKRSALHDPMELEGSGIEYPALSFEYEYDEPIASLHEDKRFLGRIPHMGRTTGGRSSGGGSNAPSRRRPRLA